MIVTLDDVKAHLRIQYDEEDAYLESLIRQAQAAAEDYCRVEFGETQTVQEIVPDTVPDPDQEPPQKHTPEPVRLAVLLMVSLSTNG